MRGRKCSPLSSGFTWWIVSILLLLFCVIVRMFYFCLVCDSFLCNSHYPIISKLNRHVYAAHRSENKLSRSFQRVYISLCTVHLIRYFMFTFTIDFDHLYVLIHQICHLFTPQCSGFTHHYF